MAQTISLGRDYVISGAIENISDLKMTWSPAKIDTTTRYGTKPLKFTERGLVAMTFTCTVFAEAATTYAVGAQVAVTCNDYTGNLIVADAERDEPDDGPVIYKLELVPGIVSANTVAI